MQATTLDYVTIFGYLILTLSVGVVFSRLNKNTDDYFRGGCKATWWLVGMSSFMASFSAWTFTGAASAAFNGGWSVMMIFFAQCFGFLIAGLWLAPWFRQMRIFAAPQLAEQRWHSALARVGFYIKLPLPVIYPAITLYGMCIFGSSMFGIDVELLIVFLGGVVILYSMSGGTWGVMATDFLQGIVLLPITVLVAGLCLYELGGISGLFELIESKGLTEDFQFFKEPGWNEKNEFTVFWAIAIFLNGVENLIDMGESLRYNAVKDGREARKAAFLGFFLFLIGAFIWFLPPITARLLYADQVAAVNIANPSESAFAIASLNLLPVALKGLMAVAIFSATMSTLDTGMNRNSASYLRIVVPDLCRLFGKQEPTSDRTRVILSRLITFLLGLIIIWLALQFANIKEMGIFQLSLKLKAFIIGFAIVGVLGLFIRRAPLFTPYVCMIAGIGCGILTTFSEDIFGTKLNFQQSFLINMSIPTLAYFACMPFYRFSSKTFKERVDAFFVKMKTPVDFEKEVGAPEDITQFILIGRFICIIAAYIAILSIFSEGLKDLLIILGLALVIGLTGAFFWRAGLKSKRELQAFTREKQVESDA